MVYAQRTTVTVDKTKVEIEKVLRRYGASNFGYLNQADKAIVLFEAKDRRVRFILPLPAQKTPPQTDAENRRRWRALLLVIKSKLESVESGIQTFEEAFLSNVVMPDGKTVYEHIKEPISITYKGGPQGAILPPPESFK